MKRTAVLVILLIPFFNVMAQAVTGKIIFNENRTLLISSLQDAVGKRYSLKAISPLFSILVDGEKIASEVPFNASGDSMTTEIIPGLKAEVKALATGGPATEYLVRFRNVSQKEVMIENVVPFGESGNHPYITAAGTKDWPQYLCRSRIFRPGYAPVGVVLPDNAWHLGWSDIETNEGKNISALARRGKRENCDIDRWAATIKPGGWIEYTFRFEMHEGDWHRGLEVMFRDRWL
ncbi:MAG TPA: hypothetical protein PK796_08035, partial [Bacteroidales bacterium]|nr:hypothetical protein [Bacteroidales bacterium]